MAIGLTERGIGMAIKVVVAKAHESQLLEEEIKKEYDSISEAYSTAQLSYKEGTINLVFVKGIYVHSERKMVTACLLVNKMEQAIKELHGEVRLRFTKHTAKIAKSTINFDEPFLGQLKRDEALLFHLNIPVKGLESNETFAYCDIEGTFENVKVTYV